MSQLMSLWQKPGGIFQIVVRDARIQGIKEFAPGQIGLGQFEGK